MKELRLYSNLPEPFLNRIQKYIDKGIRVEIVYNDHNWNRHKRFEVIDAFKELDKQLYILLNSEELILCSQLISVDIKRPRVDRCGIDAAANPCGDASEY